ncbi:hypothetical protein D3C87_1084410 [compost metagenome]
MTTELNQEIKPLTLDTLKQLKAAQDARVSIDGTTKEQRELLERFAGVDMLAHAIQIAEAQDARILELEDLLPNAIVTAERDTYAEQLAGALALLAENRTMLGHCREHFARSAGHPAILAGIERALALTPPQALAKQSASFTPIVSGSLIWLNRCDLNKLTARMEALERALAHCQADAKGRGDGVMLSIISHALDAKKGGQHA